MQEQHTVTPRSRLLHSEGVSYPYLCFLEPLPTKAPCWGKIKTRITPGLIADRLDGAKKSHQRPADAGRQQASQLLFTSECFVRDPGRGTLPFSGCLRLRSLRLGTDARIFFSGPACLSGAVSGGCH